MEELYAVRQKIRGQKQRLLVELRDIKGELVTSITQGLDRVKFRGIHTEEIVFGSDGMKLSFPLTVTSILIASTQSCCDQCLGILAQFASHHPDIKITLAYCKPHWKSIGTSTEVKGTKGQFSHHYAHKVEQIFHSHGATNLVNIYRISKKIQKLTAD